MHARPGLAFAAIALLLALGLPAAAQESASFRLDEHVLNLAGSPASAVTPSSASFRLSFACLGEGFIRSGLSSASFRLDSSFGAAYVPPGEVEQLEFLDKTTLAWGPERSAGTYNAYRSPLTTLPGGSYGECWQQDLAAASVTDAESVPVADGFFYLVTAKNRLHEEGTKGRDSTGAARGGETCP